jgi:hypothetical protein
MHTMRTGQISNVAPLDAGAIRPTVSIALAWCCPGRASSAGPRELAAYFNCVEIEENVVSSLLPARPPRYATMAHRLCYTRIHHQPEAQHPKSSAIHKLAGRLPHLL